MGFTVAFEIFEGVFEFYAMFGQEGVCLHWSLKAEDAAQLGGRDFASAIGIENQDFQDGTREVEGCVPECSQKLVRKRDGDGWHGFRIPKVAGKSTDCGVGPRFSA